MRAGSIDPRGADARRDPLEQRMEAMGMEPVGLAHQTCPIECVHYGKAEA